MKNVKVRFNNVWNDEMPGDFDIVNFHIPKECNINIIKEYVTLYHCHEMLNSYDIEDEEELKEALEAYGYDKITEQDLDYATQILGSDGTFGITTERLVDFIKLKYPEISYEYPQENYDLEIDID